MYMKYFLIASTTLILIACSGEDKDKNPVSLEELLKSENLIIEKIDNEEAKSVVNNYDVGVYYKEYNSKSNPKQLKPFDISIFGEDGIVLKCKDNRIHPKQRESLIASYENPIVYLSNKREGLYTSMFVIEGNAQSYPYSFPLSIWYGKAYPDADEFSEYYSIGFRENTIIYDPVSKTNMVDVTRRHEILLDRKDLSYKYKHKYNLSTTSGDGQCQATEINFLNTFISFAEEMKKKSQENKKRYEEEHNLVKKTEPNKI